MSDETTKEQPTRDSGRRERWTDSTKIIWALFAIIGALLGGWSNQISSAVTKLETRIVVIETDRGSLKSDMEYLKQSVNELKVDVKALHK